MARQVNGVIRVGDKIEFDEATKEWFKQNPDKQTTIAKCENCGLWYKPFLGHKCEVNNANLY